MKRPSVGGRKDQAAWLQPLQQEIEARFPSIKEPKLSDRSVRQILLMTVTHYF
jgi:hypothetical protein